MYRIDPAVGLRFYLSGAELAFSPALSILKKVGMRWLISGNDEHGGGMIREAMVGLLISLTAAGYGSEPLRVLMIGNSFSLSVMKELPEIVQSQDRHRLDITSMYIGGCPLRSHVENYERAQSDPSFKPYRIDRFVSGEGRLPPRWDNLPSLLSEPGYDIITIQQASAQSFRPESWEPWGDRLVAAVREKMPRARILIHQTWSYRADAGALSRWKISSSEMFRRLHDVYADRAAHFGFGIIPTGDAVELFRKQSPIRFTSFSAPALKRLSFPQLPPDAGDVVGRHLWKKQTDGRMTLSVDSNHLNSAGEYLQGCVWFGALFGEDPERISYTPSYLSADTAALLRRCAALALAENTAAPEKK